MDLSHSKIAILVIGGLLLVPLGVVYCRENPRFVRHVFFFLVGSTALSHLADVNFFSYETYRGTARGIEITITDLIALVLGLYAFSNGRLVKLTTLPYWFLHCALIGIFVASIYWSADNPYPLFGWFVIAQYVRCLFIYWIVYSLIDNLDYLETFINALVVTAIIVGVTAIAERYLLGVHRISGVFAHPNVLGSYAAFIASFLFSILLDFPAISRKKYAFLAAGCSLAVVATLLTISRAAIAALVLGLFVVVCRSLFTRVAWRKVHVFALIGVLLLGALYKSADTYMERIIDPQTNTWDGGRDAMNNIAVDMARKNFFGAGINNYSYVASDYGGLYLPPASLEYGLPPVHSIYYLTLGEVGLVGFVVYFGLWLAYLKIGALSFFGFRQDFASGVNRALFVAMSVLLAHSVFEDSPRRTAFILLLGIVFAILARIKTSGMTGNLQTTAARRPSSRVADPHPYGSSSRPYHARNNS